MDVRRNQPRQRGGDQGRDRREGVGTPLAPRPRSVRARTLIAACREAPELFGGVHVAVYAGELTRGGGRAALDAASTGAAAPDGSDQPDFRRAWGYQFDRLPPPGCWLVDLDCRPQPARVWGASRLPDPPYRLKVPDGADVALTVRGVVRVPGATGRFPIATGEKAELARVAARLRALGETVPLPRAVEIIDASDGGFRKPGGRRREG